MKYAASRLFAVFAAFVAGLLALGPWALAQPFQDPARSVLEASLGVIAEGKLNLPPDPLAEAYLSEVARVGLAGSQIAKDDQASYEREIIEAGLETVLDPAALKGDPSLAEAQAKVRRLKNIVASYRALSLQRVQENRARLAKVEGPRDLRASVLKGFDEAKGLPAIRQMWELEASAINETGEIVAFLSRTKGRWRVADGVLQFDRDADVAAFNARIDKIQRIADQQGDLEAAGERRALQSAAELNDPVKTASPSRTGFALPEVHISSP